MKGALAWVIYEHRHSHTSVCASRCGQWGFLPDYLFCKQAQEVSIQITLTRLSCSRSIVDEEHVGVASSCSVTLTFLEVQGLLHMQKACHTPASVMCANRLLNSRTGVWLLVHARWPFAQNWQPGQSYCYCSKWMARNAEILDKWPCFLFFSWQYKIFRMEKKKPFFIFLFFCVWKKSGIPNLHI